MRVLVVDDHPAVRAGLIALLRSEPGIVPVASAAGIEDAVEECSRQVPDVAVVDYHLRDGNGLDLCRKVKALPHPPSVFDLLGVHRCLVGDRLDDRRG